MKSSSSFHLNIKDTPPHTHLYTYTYTPTPTPTPTPLGIITLPPGDKNTHNHPLIGNFYSYLKYWSIYIICHLTNTILFGIRCELWLDYSSTLLCVGQSHKIIKCLRVCGCKTLKKYEWFFKVLSLLHYKMQTPSSLLSGLRLGTTFVSQLNRKCV